ncbi:DMT family transporter [Halostreptopolyspora alba]|uniref:QacE family quaternary ammonium compound efflux SMR transporter n=1 Tax=Halostreptopolyspora alba TaxID=2487137 RepID=A0A3N0E8I8_9ACTN|nr:QacE family quaternary ammonium compound efflux SMR transporter [Nocardiopsaceae bacterium YIM 96095]
MTASSPQSEQPTTASSQHARAWVVLLVAGVFEIGYAVSVGGSQGFTDPSWSVAAGVFFLLTVLTLSLALKHLDVGIGYAVWAGIGASGAAVASSVLFDQPLTPSRVLWLAVIIVGIVGLKLASSPQLTAAEEPAEPAARQ